MMMMIIIIIIMKWSPPRWSSTGARALPEESRICPRRAPSGRLSVRLAQGQKRPSSASSALPPASVSSPSGARRRPAAASKGRRLAARPSSRAEPKDNGTAQRGRAAACGVEQVGRRRTGKNGPKLISLLTLCSGTARRHTKRSSGANWWISITHSGSPARNSIITTLSGLSPSQSGNLYNQRGSLSSLLEGKQASQRRGCQGARATGGRSLCCASEWLQCFTAVPMGEVCALTLVAA